VLDGQGRPTRDPEAFYAAPPGAIFPFGGHKGSGLSLFCEILAGALTGGGSSHPDNPSAAALVNNMLSLIFDPAAVAGTGAFAADLERLVGWVAVSPPLEPGGSVLLPGEIERRCRAERLTKGIPLDDETLRQLAAAAASVGIAMPHWH
jgi:hydroxycarboxylate dehydrogenase B